MCVNCSALNIPEHLHTNGRTAESEFGPEELVYRRFSISQCTNENGILKLNHTAIPVSDDSCNRSKFSKPQDVLYSSNSINHYTKNGVFSLGVSNIFEQEKTIISNDKPRTFVLKVVHKPENCMYPHCEIIVEENGVVISKNKPPSIKSFVREELLKVAKILHAPAV